MAHESQREDETTDSDAATVSASTGENTAAASTGEQATSTGLDENIAGALAYVFGLVTGVLFYVLEEDNRFVRFHAAQSIVLSIGVIAFFFGLFVVQVFIGALLGEIPILGLLISAGFGLLGMAIGFAAFLLYVYMIFSAFKGRETRLPIVGPLAEKHLR